MSGSNVFALSSNVTGTISTPVISPFTSTQNDITITGGTENPARYYKFDTLNSNSLKLFYELYTISNGVHQTNKGISFYYDTNDNLVVNHNDINGSGDPGAIENVTTSSGFLNSGVVNASPGDIIRGRPGDNTSTLRVQYTVPTFNQGTPSLTFDNYNKLTLENFTTSESDTRTAKLTDPNDVEYTLGQTQNDIYIEEEGDYILEVTNSDQSAVVKKNVTGSVGPENFLQLHWNTYSSPASDSSGNSLTGTLNSVTNTNGAFTFDGSSSYIQLSTSGATDSKVQLATWDISCEFYKTGAGTLSSWVDTTAIVLITKGINSSDGAGYDINYGLVIDSNNKIKTGFEEAGSNQVVLVGTTTISNNQWYTTRSTFDGTTLKVYLNGVLENSVTPSYIPASNDAGPLLVGAGRYTTAGNTVAFFQGQIKNIKINKNGVLPPSLTFDNYNKLSINNLTPTSSRLTYGSNTYEIGTASNVYIEHGGTYKMATGDANTFALVSNAVGTTPAPKPDYTNIWAGEYGGMVVDSDGKLYTWGNDGNNQSGRGASDRTPTHISTISDPVSNVWVEGAPGRTRIVKTSTDKWYMWGMNLDKYKIFGQTGDQTAPVDVTSDFTTYFGAQGTSDTTRIIKVVMSSSACSALAADGKVWSWGVDGNRNELGKNTTNGTTATPFKNTVPTIPSTTPTVVSPLPVVAGSGDQGFTMVYYQTVGTKFYYKSDSHSGTGTAISYDYSTQTWGDEGVQVPFHFNTTSTFASTTSLVNPAEIHGFGSQQNHSGALYFSVSNPYYEAPTELSNITDIRSLHYGKLALDSNGDVWQWGTIGTGNTGYATKQTGLDSITIIGIGAGYFTAYAWDAAGTIYSIGQGTEGQLGNGASSDQDSTWQTVTTLQGKTIYGIYGAGYSVFAHTSDGVYACGQGTNGRLGMGNNNDLNVFTKSTALSALSIYKLDFGHGPGYIITTDGKGYALGYDYLNSIPTPLSGDKNVPTEASSLTNLSLVYQPPAITIYP
jgi:alpha-tubulin suppressor-like RCC1 family protein